jgi:heptosyltransferase III
MPKVLVIRGGAIGDFILTLPAIKLLRDNIPDVRLEILGYKPITELAVAAGLAEATRHLEHSAMARLFAPGSQIDDDVADYFRSFNVVVSYLYDPDGYFRGNMERLKVKTFLEASHRVEPGNGHAAVQLAKPLERIAMWLEDPAPRLAFDPVADAEERRPLIAIHPGSGALKKCLPPDHWQRFGQSFAALHPEFQLVVVTGEAEFERGVTASMRSALAGTDALHWDQLPLTDLACRLAGVRGFIGHDSGISHLAAACGVRCLLFFGPTDAETWAPKNPGVQVFDEQTGDLSAVPYDTFAAEASRFISKCAL